MFKSEKEFIACIRKKFAERSPAMIKTFGEDCAALKLPRNKTALISCDDFIEGRHFEYAYITLVDAGQKALLANISDIISMGGIPRYYMVSLMIPKKFRKENALDLYHGMKMIAKKYHVALIGGNTEVYSGPLSIRITIIGEAKNKKIFCRNNAKPDDLICITNKTGLSALGLLLLKKGWRKHNSKFYDNKGILEKRSYIKNAIREFLLPSIPYALCQILAQHSLTNTAIDLSDGLVSDLYEICKESSVGAILYKNALPADQSILHFCQNEHIDFFNLMLSGGEDYQLLFTISQDKLKKLKTKVSNYEIHCIGKIIKDPKCKVILHYNGKTKILSETLGYDHFIQ